MCEPISASTAAYIAIASTAASMAMTAVAAHKNASAIEDQEKAQQRVNADAAGQKESMAAMQARAARAQSTVAASGAGINLGSNSFLGSLQVTTMNNANENGLIEENLKTGDAASLAQANSLLAEKGSFNYAGAALQTALAGENAYMSTRKMGG